MTNLRHFGLLATIAFAASATGCAMFTPWNPTGEDVAVKAAQRKAETLASLERRRDAATLEAAADHLGRGDRSTSRQMLEQLLVRDPKLSAARVLLARCYLETNELPAAEQQLRTGLETDEPNASLHYELGLLLDSQAKLPEAREHFERAAKLEPHNDLYRLAARTSPPSPLGGEGSGVRGRPAKNRLPSPKTAATDPASRAAALLQAGQPDQALELVQSELEAQPDSAALHRLAGAAHLARREADLAAEALRQSIALDNSCGLSYFLLGHALSQTGDERAAEAAFQEAARRDARLARGTTPHSSSAPLAPATR